jgi:8-oxo-dGTP pyrophosphatase MutT (NUDIX family)
MAVEILHSEYLSRHPYFTARKDSYRLESGKLVDPYFLVEMPVSVTAMALTKDNKVIMISQYRHPVQQTLLELPGGFIDEKEEPAVAIRRELLEETGYIFEHIYPLSVTAANPGVLNNFSHLFLATGGEQVGEQHLDANEEIAIHYKTLEEARALLMNGSVQQSMHALCMFYAFVKLEELA